MQQLPPPTWNTPLTQKTFLVALFFFAIGGVIVTHQNIALEKASWPRKAKDLYRLPSPTALRTLSLGYKTAFADLVWIQALLYAGEHFSDDKGSIHWIPQYFEAIRTLDPQFRHPYEWAATLLVYNRYYSTRESTKESMRILEKGRQQFPQDYFFPYALAMSYIFEINLLRRTLSQLQEDHKEFCQRPAPPHLTKNQLIKETRTCMHRIGGRLMMQAAAKPNAPTYIATQAASILRRGRSDQKAICHHLMDILWRSNNPTSLELIRQRLQTYCRAQSNRGSLCRERLFTQRWLKQAPYLPRVIFGHLDVPPHLDDPAPLSLRAPQPADPCETTDTQESSPRPTPR